jgi:hypothetical protein
MENIDEIKASIFSMIYLLKKLDKKIIELNKLLKGEKPEIKYKKANLIEKSIILEFK